MSGIKILRKLLMKEAMKRDAPFQKEGIMSISKSLSTNVDSKVNRIVEGAKKQGIDFDKYNEEQVKYILELNRPKLQPRAIPADSPEGRGITSALLGRKEGKVIKTDFGKPFTKERSLEEKMVDDAIDNSSPGFSGDAKYDAQLVADDLSEKMYGKDFYDLSQKQQMDLYDKAYTGLSKQRFKGMKKPKDDDPEDMATGGRAGFSMGRRAFLKLLGGAAAGIGALKTGALKMFGKEGAKNLPPIKTPVVKLENTTTDMPDWFPSFVNKFRDEGKAENIFQKKKVEVSKEEFDQAFKEGKGENYYTDVARTPEYKANNPDHMDFFKLEDTDERLYTKYTNDKLPGVELDDVDGQIDVTFKNEYEQPVIINYTKPGAQGPDVGRPDMVSQGIARQEKKLQGDFAAVDAQPYTVDPDGGFEVQEYIARNLDEMLEGTTRKMEEYTTGKKTKISAGEFEVGRAEAEAERLAEAAAEAGDDFASGGRVGLLRGGGVIRVMLKKIAEQMGRKPSELLAVTNYKSLPAKVKQFLTKEQFELIKKDMRSRRVEQFENLRDMVKSRQEFDKSAEALKKMGMDISDTMSPIMNKGVTPGGTTADDLLMMEQVIKNLRMKDRKLNASGGLAGMLGE